MNVLRGILALLLAAPFTLAAEAPPAWVQRQGADPAVHPPERFLAGYALSSPSGTEAEQRRQASAQAREVLASSIRTRVTSEYTSRVTQVDKHMTSYAQNVVKTHADLELEGLETLVWRDAKTNVTHALALLDKARTLTLLEDRLSRQARECAAAFTAARTTGDVAGLSRARQIRERMAVLSGAKAPEPPCPGPAEIVQELRKALETRPGLDRHAALAALDLGADLPKGIRVLMDRITFADSPFCGTFSAYLEETLAVQLAALGQVRILDKAMGREALVAAGGEGSLADALRSQAAVRGVVFDLGEEVKVTLRVVSAAGDELAATTLTLPAALVRKAGLKLVPDNYQEARKALEICDAQVQASTLEVKVVADRGQGGIYRKGDKLHLFLKANMDCYVKVLYHQVDGTQVLIFPNRFHPDGHLVKGRLYQLPPDDNSFELEVQEPFGAELVKVIASTAPIEIEAQKPDANGLREVRESLGGVLGHTRGIALKAAKIQYAEATAVVNTMAAAK